MSQDQEIKTSKIKKSKTKNNLPYLLNRFGKTLILIAAVLFAIFFYPLILHEIKFFIRDRSYNDSAAIVTDERNQIVARPTILAADKDFSIVIPKINANSKVIPNVNPYDSAVYQVALKDGVAHAEGTVFPGQIGNTFLFAHSSVNFYEAMKYNSIFYLLYKLKEGDVFYLVYGGVVYKYEVTQSKVVKASEIDYLSSDSNKKTATLMTCWPPGTTANRYVVVGVLN